MTEDGYFESAVAAESWDDIARLLVDLAHTPGASDELHRAIVTLLSRGRVQAPAEAMARRGEALPLVLRVFLAEAVGRRIGLHEYQLEDLERDVQSADLGVDVELWLAAIHAEHYLWRADLSGFSIASRALYEHGEADLGPIGLIGRARLRRTLGIAEFALNAASRPSSAAITESKALRDSEADLAACDCTDQIVFGRALVALLNATLFRDAAAHEVGVLRRCVVEATELESDLLAPQWLMLAWAAILAWDLQMARLALGEIETGLHGETFQDMRDAARAVVDLVESDGARHVAEAVRALGERLRTSPLMIQGLAIFVCGALLDYGHADVAAEFVPSPTASAPMPEPTIIDLETIRLRLALLTEPDTISYADLEEIIEANTRTNGERMAGSTCLKLAHDCALVARIDSAERLRSRADALLPAPAQRTSRERFHAARLDPLPSRRERP